MVAKLSLREQLQREYSADEAVHNDEKTNRSGLNLQLE